MNFTAILSNIGPADILDILFISIISYQLYVWFWGTKAFKALLGVVVLSGIFMVAESWGLFLTTWVFQILWQVFVILLIILFQKEIRQMLERFNPLKNMGFKQRIPQEEWIPEFSKWAFDAAKRKMGAMIVFERKDLVFDLITKGIAMESDPAPEILNTIFNKNSPLHDGAILISNGRILKTSCYLPLTTSEDLPQKWGTRHRAAFGLTEQCDAWVVVISEESGEISFAINRTIQKVADKAILLHLLKDVIHEEKEPAKRLDEKIKAWFTRKYKIKGAVFAMVFIMWLLFAGQQNFEKKIALSLNFKNLPENLIVSAPSNPGISVVCRGLRKDVSLLNANNVLGTINAFSAKPGTFSYPLTVGNLILPNDRIHVVKITPSRIDLTFKIKDASPDAEVDP